MSQSKFINFSFFYVALLITVIFPDLNSASAKDISSKQLLLSKTIISNQDLLAENASRGVFQQNQSDIPSKASRQSQEDHLLLAIDPNPEARETKITELKLRQTKLTSLSFFLLFFIPLGIFYPLFLFYRKLLGVEPQKPGYPREKNYKSKFLQSSSPEIFDVALPADTPLATVSKLQIAFSPQALRLRQKLEQISSSDDLNQNQDMVDLMCKTILALVSQQDWTHVNYSSESLPLEEVQEEFNIISHIERNKFITKELSLVNHHQQRNLRDDNSSRQDFYRYVVVTLVFCTTHNTPLFNKIHTEEQLIEVLGKLGKMKQDSLIKFELLWNPQQQGKYINNDQLLMEYSDLIRLL